MILRIRRWRLGHVRVFDSLGKVLDNSDGFLIALAFGIQAVEDSVIP